MTNFGGEKGLETNFGILDFGPTFLKRTSQRHLGYLVIHQQGYDNR